MFVRQKNGRRYGRVFQLRQAIAIFLCVNFLFYGFPAGSVRAAGPDAGASGLERQIKETAKEAVKRIVNEAIKKIIEEAMGIDLGGIDLEKKLREMIEEPLKTIIEGAVNKIVEETAGKDFTKINLERQLRRMIEEPVKKIIDDAIKNTIEKPSDRPPTRVSYFKRNRMVEEPFRKIIEGATDVAFNEIAPAPPAVQIPAEARPAPAPAAKPAPSPETVQLPPVEPSPPYSVPVEDSGMGVGGALLIGGLVAGVAVVAAVAASGLETTPTTSTGSGCPSASSYGCCTVSGGIRVVGVTALASCGCPSGSTYNSTVTIGGVRYYQCTCNNCKSTKGIIGLPNYQSLKMPGSGLTLFNSNLSSGVDLFKTKFEILGACSADDSMLNTTLGLQVKGEYSRQRGHLVFSPFIQLQHQRSGGLAEIAGDNVYVYTTTLYGMDILYVPYNLTLSSMIRQAIQSEDSESLNAAVVQLTVKF